MTSHRDFRVVGKAVPRVDGRAKVTGTAKYTVDLAEPGMLHAAVARSTCPHGRLLRVDTSSALAVPGVVCAVTGADLQGLRPFYGHIITDHPVMAIDKVRFVGEPICVVVARDARTAHRAAQLVRADYQELRPMVSVADALAADAPEIHEHAYSGGGGVFWETLPESVVGNIAHQTNFGWGDVDAALDDADLVVGTRSSYPMLYAYAMEPYCAIASYTGGTLRVTSSTQHPFMVRQELARIFQLPLAAVHVRAPYVGGGYGSKSWTKVEPLAAVASWKAGQPVRLVLSIEESILTTRTDAGDVTVRTGFDHDGHILARDFSIDFNTGAYADSSPSILDKAVHRCFGPYRIPNLRVRARLVYTTTVPASSYRGFGAPQTNLAGEYNIDLAAGRLGLPADEVRRRNLVPPGGQLMPDRRGLDADLAADLVLARRALSERADLGVDASKDVLRGSGIACSASDAGAYPASIVSVTVLSDGSVRVATGAVEMGQGSGTALSQIVAEELGVDFDEVHIVQSDTAASPLERTTNASRTTTIVGLAAQDACRQVQLRLREMAAANWKCEKEEVTVQDGLIAAPGHDKVPYRDVIDEWFGPGAGEVTATGVVRRVGELVAMPPFWEIGMVGVDVAVETATGTLTVTHLVTVGDVGFAVNPLATKAQELGAATQGIGGALMEELLYDEAELTNPNVVDYRVPRTTDMPQQWTPLLAERRDGVGPYGAKGIGEGSLNPVGAAICTALAAATGRWPERVRLPLTPERVWRWIQGDDL
jgi:CO/xanthine dehydrogenase Mo-binding subunit